MPISTPTFKTDQINVDIVNATTHTITNLSVPLASTEVSHTLQTDLKQLMIRARNNAKLQFSFVAAESGTKYITIMPGVVYQATDIDLAAGTLYIQSSKASTVVEIEEWS